MRRTEIAEFRAESYETLQGMARKTACSEREIKGFAVVQGELDTLYGCKVMHTVEDAIAWLGDLVIDRAG